MVPVAANPVAVERTPAATKNASDVKGNVTVAPLDCTRSTSAYGAAIAFAAWLLLAVSLGARMRVTLIVLLFSAYIIAERLAPFQFAADGRVFGWIPFRSFLYGALELNILSFLEKAFLYGAVIWLLDKSGLRLGVSTILVAIVLFATSLAETHLPGRSAEITDALMALLIGAIIAAVKAPAEVAGKGTA